MTDEAEEDLGDIQVIANEPLVIPAGDGCVIIPCIDSLTDSPDPAPMATAAREWSAVELQNGGKRNAVDTAH